MSETLHMSNGMHALQVRAAHDAMSQTLLWAKAAKNNIVDNSTSPFLLSAKAQLEAAMQLLIAASANLAVSIQGRMLETPKVDPPQPENAISLLSVDPIQPKVEESKKLINSLPRTKQEAFNLALRLGCSEDVFLSYYGNSRPPVAGVRAFNALLDRALEAHKNNEETAHLFVPFEE